MVIKGRKAGINKDGFGSNPSILDVPLMDPKRNTRKIKKNVLLISVEGEIQKQSVALGTLGENCETQGLGWLGIKKHFSLLKIPGGQISLATNIDNKSVDQSDSTKVCGTTLYSRMDQEPWIQNNRDLSNVEGGSMGL
jgi:hypothetical protein